MPSIRPMLALLGNYPEVSATKRHRPRLHPLEKATRPRFIGHHPLHQPPRSPRSSPRRTPRATGVHRVPTRSRHLMKGTLMTGSRIMMWLHLVTFLSLTDVECATVTISSRAYSRMMDSVILAFIPIRREPHVLVCQSPDRREGSYMYSPGTTVQKNPLKVVLVWPLVKPKWSTLAARPPPPDVIDGSSSYPKSWVQALVLFLPCPHASEIPVVLRTFK